MRHGGEDRNGSAAYPAARGSSNVDPRGAGET